MYQQLFGGSGTNGAGGTEDDTNTLVASAGAAAVREETGCVSFDAFVVAHVPKTNMVQLAPFNVASALMLPGAGEYWVPATADGRAIRLVHKQQRGPSTGEKVKRAVTFVPLAPHEEAAGVIADLHGITISMYVKEPGSRAAIIPPPFTFVRVVNYRLTVGDKGDERLFPNATALDRARFPDLNALPTIEQLAALFPIDGGQALPTPAPLMPLADYLKTQPIVTKDANMKRKEEKAILRRVAPPMPLVLLRSDRAWRPRDGFIRHPIQQELMLPPTGLPPAGAPEPPAFFATLLVNAGDGVVKEVVVDSATNRKQIKLLGHMDFDVYERRERPGAVVEHFRVRNATLFADKFAGLGVTHPAWIERLLAQTPVPVHMVASIDLRETTENAQNRDPATLCPYSPAGVLSADVIAAVWRADETLHRRAIPATRALIIARYGGEFARLRLIDDKRPPTDRTPESWRAAQIDNPYAREADFLMTGVLAFDGDTPNQVPGEDEADFWALPLVPLRTPLPMAPRPDPRCQLPAAEQPLAVALTPDEGDAFIRASLPAPPKTLLDWMEPDFVTPKFLFFATRKREQLALLDASAPARNLVPTTDAEARAALVAATAQVAVATLPADMDIYRTQLVLQTVGPLLHQHRQQQALPFEKERESVKRQREADKCDGDKPDVKRARIESPPPSSPDAQAHPDAVAQVVRVKWDEALLNSDDDNEH